MSSTTENNNRGPRYVLADWATVDVLEVTICHPDGLRSNNGPDGP